MKTKGIALLMLVIFSMSSFAQETEKRFAIELNSGISMAVAKIDNTILKPGVGFEGVLHYRFIPHLGIYGGWGWNKFASDNNSFAGKDVCFEETGYVIGLNFTHPIGSSSVAYYVRAGALYNHIETEDADGDIVNDSKHGLGFQLAAGIDIPLRRNWSFTPGLKFNFLSRDTRYEGVAKTLDYQYISARIGFLKRF